MERYPEVFFIGDVSLDEYYSTETFPSLADKVIVQTLPAQMGGMIANAACVYASYGQPANFFTALNGGIITQQLLEGLQKYGIDVRHMVRDDTLPDSKTIIILAENEHTVFIPTLNLQRCEISRAALADICRAGVIFSNICELKPLRCGDMDVTAILKEARDNGCRLWCDLDVGDISAEDDWFFDYIDTLFLNERGFTRLSRGKRDGEWISSLFNRGVRMIVVTCAEKGCRVLTRGDVFSIPGVATDVVDVTGAGDTFCGSFLFAYTRTDDLRICAEFANYAAAHAVSGLGARYGVVGIEAVLAFAESKGAKLTHFAGLID